jgi:outer membrane protein assembly factor BamB
VLIRDGIAYLAAGHSSFLDGGIFVYGLDAATGQLRHQLHLAGPDPQAETSRVTAGRMPGAVPDILTCDDSGLYLRHIRLDWQLSLPPPEQFDWNVKSETHLLPGSGFLDDTLFNRTIWQYGTRTDRSQMLCIDGTDVYGLRIYEGISWNCPIHHVGDGHLIFRQDISRPVPPPRPQDRGRMIRVPTERYVWHTRLPLRVRAMLLSARPEQCLFVAGVPDELDKEDPLAYIEGRRGAQLVVLDTASGRHMSHVQLESPPTWDGMAAAHGRLYLSTADGTLVCLAE